MKRIAFMLLLLVSQSAFADCVCRCVNGQVQPICSSTMDLAPLCGAQLCPLTPSSLQPLTPPTLPPLGTTGCQNKQVLNPYSHQYEWKLICQ